MLLAPLLISHNLDYYLEHLQNLAVLYLPKVLAAIVLLCVGWWVIGWASG